MSENIIYSFLPLPKTMFFNFKVIVVGLNDNILHSKHLYNYIIYIFSYYTFKLFNSD